MSLTIKKICVIVSLCLFIFFNAAGFGCIAQPPGLIVLDLPQVKKVMHYNGTHWLRISYTGRKICFEFRRYHSRQLIRVFK